MLESTLYLVGKEVGDGKSYVSRGEPCDMCKRLIINAGIAQVIVRDSATAFHVLSVIDLIKENR